MAPQPSRAGHAKSRAEILDQLLRSDGANLLNQARRHCTRPADADDALSDACVAFLRHYGGPPGLDALRWMMTVVKHSARAITRHRRVCDAREELAEVSVPRSAEDVFGRSEEIADMREHFRRLKPDERTALLLLGLGYSYEEIAELRGWTRSKVNRCIAEGRGRVRGLMAESDFGTGGERR